MSQFELLLALWVASISFVTSQVPGGYYQTKYENLNIDDVLNHKRLVHHYAACLLNRGPCPPQGTDLKRVLPEALGNVCLRCTDKQKFIAYRIIKRLKNEYPTLWRELVDYWDPTEANVRKFEELFNKTTSTEDQQNSVLFNRFGEDASQNDLAASIKPNSDAYPYPPASSTAPYASSSKAPTTTTTTTTRRASSSSTMAPFTTTTTTTTSTTTRRTTRAETITRSTLLNRLTTPTATAESIGVFFRPLDLPFLKAKILGDFTKVIKAGTEVAGMVFQALTGQNN